ncbi:hypothetical protein ACFWY9_33275 [Amycolatopsis sp. NPDC059027]|uniref:hypothetical protein n=1 Tax=unclassified Amycolatopsis TaxID=2618356 RepID=UPI00366F31AA
MTDFANRLLGRAGGATIRPLLPTLFEPVTAREPEPLPPMGAVSPDRPHRTDETETAAPARPQDASPAEPLSRMATPAPAAAPREPRAVPPPSPVAGLPITSRESTVDEHLVVPPGRVPEAPVVAGTRTVPREMPIPLRHSGTRPVPVTTREMAEPVSYPVVAPDRTVEPRPDEPPDVARNAERPTVPARRSRKAAPVARQAEPAAEPVVHISIGRVEVKATAEPGKNAAPQRKETPKQPVLGLAEYLRERAGGGSR